MNSHRGISAIVGTVFLIAIVVGALTYITYSLETMANFSEQLIAEESRQKNIQNEQFEITSLDVTSGNKLDAVIKNTGQIPLEITTLYIDEQGVDDVVQKIIIDKTIAPGTSFDFLTENIDVDIDSAKGYNLKISSSRGESKLFYMNSGSAEPLYLSKHILPTPVSTNFPATMLFVVVNNMSNNNSLYNLTPTLDVDNTLGQASYVQVSGPTPTKYPVLKPGDVATFEYVYTIGGDQGDYINYGFSLQNGYPLPASPGHLQSLNGTISIKDVELAVESGSSIISQGLLTSESVEANTLFFHDSSFSIPATWPSQTKQMSGATSFGSGEVLNTDDNKIIHITASLLQSATLSAGKYNASLQYYSNVTSPDLPDPTLAFFFECADCPSGDLTPESIGSLSLIVDGNNNPANKGYFKEKENEPEWTEFGGPDNDGYFTFSATKESYLKAEWKEDMDYPGTNVYSNVGAVPDTDAMWVRIPPTTRDHMPLLFIGETKDGIPKDLYEISIGDPDTTDDDGKIVFRFDEENDAGRYTKCVTDNRYDNNKWQHIVVVRTDASDTTHNTDCEIWVNGTDTEATVSPNGVDFTIDKYKDAGIGTSQFGMSGDGDDYLLGDVALWMHWNDDELTAAQIEDLFYTNYGENGTRIHLVINHTDSDGNIYGSALVEEVDFEIPFYDPASRSATPGILLNSLFDNALEDAQYKYSRYNVTGTSSSGSSLIAGDRLGLSLEIDDDEQNLPINIWIDDADYLKTPNPGTLDDTNTFLQTPEIDPDWPTFSNIVQGETTTLTVFNEGPEGVWFTFPGTRFVVTTIDGLSSFGAMPWCDNPSGSCPTEPISLNSATFPLNIDQDGPYIPDQATATITFNALCDPIMKIPVAPADCTYIPVGSYNAFIYLSGFDEEGTSFIRTISLGLVTVTAT